MVTVWPFSFCHCAANALLTSVRYVQQFHRLGVGGSRSVACFTGAAGGCISGIAPAVTTATRQNACCEYSTDQQQTALSPHSAFIVQTLHFHRFLLLLLF
jgi:hypothetical protein